MLSFIIHICHCNSIQCFARVVRINCGGIVIYTGISVKKNGCLVNEITFELKNELNP